MENTPQHVARLFLGTRAVDVRPWPRRGFSGSDLWSVGDGVQQWLLRAWPAGSVDLSRLQWIQHVIEGLAERGISEIPAPLSSTAGHVAERVKDRWWTCEPVMPGAADYHTRPSEQRLAAAMHVLARIHLASGAAFGQPPAVVAQLDQRLRLLRLFRRHRLAEIRKALGDRARSWVVSRDHVRQVCQAAELVAERLEQSLAQAVGLPCAQMPCIRDIWHDHVLFVEDRVTGIVDMGAMQVTTPAADISRLVGSLAGDDQAIWNQALAAYAEVRPIDQVESKLISVFDQTGVLLAPLNWLWWLLVEGRSMGAADAIADRFETLSRRLAMLADRGPDRMTISPGSR